MKRVLACLFLIFCSVLLVLMVSFVAIMMALSGIPINGTASLAVYLFMIIPFALALSGIYFGAKGTVYISEKICPSIMGTRYVVFGLLLTIIELIQVAIIAYQIYTETFSFEFTNLSHAVSASLFLVYGIVLLIIGIKIERKEKKQKELEKIQPAI